MAKGILVFAEQSEGTVRKVVSEEDIIELDDAGHEPPPVGEPACYGGQGDDVDGTDSDAENDAVKQVKLPGR